MWGDRMGGDVRNLSRRLHPWHAGPLALLAVAGLALLSACGSGQAKPEPTQPPADTATARPATATAVPAIATPAPAPTSPPAAASDAATGGGSADTGGSSSAPSYQPPPPAPPGPSRGLDRLIIPAIGVNAPVYLSVVGTDGVMGNPSGPVEVVWYDFSAIPGVGGYPGTGGNAVYAGHVNYHDYGPAVFANIDQLGPGDIIEVDRGDGVVITYQVEWTDSPAADADFNPYVVSHGVDEITLVTCIGDWDPAAHAYSNRFVVRGKRI